MMITERRFVVGAPLAIAVAKEAIMAEEADAARPRQRQERGAR